MNPYGKMKYLIIIRHAKSSWSDLGIDDFNRPLNQRGYRDAPEMGRRLAESPVEINRIITSPANRAQTTAGIIGRAMKIPKSQIDPRNDLYLASSEVILELIRDFDDSWNHVLVIGHNPGMTGLVNQLTGAEIENIPTCGVARIEIDTDNWKSVCQGKCQLLDFDYPKNNPS